MLQKINKFAKKIKDIRYIFIEAFEKIIIVIKYVLSFNKIILATPTCN